MRNNSSFELPSLSRSIWIKTKHKQKNKNKTPICVPWDDQREAEIYTF